MEFSCPSISCFRATARSLSLVLVTVSWIVHASAQTIVNPGFQDGTSGWNGCPLEINPANVYGGPDGNLVAEVDGDNDPNSTADDKRLCQTITGFTVGSVYSLQFYAARRQGGPTPVTPSVNVSLDGVIDETVTRSGGWSMELSMFYFTAQSTSHTLHITPNFTVSYGMLFDNFSISLISALPIELVYFTAVPDEEGVMLNWATASERNNSHFVVERSSDNSAWNSVATVLGAGDSRSMIAYAIQDASPLPGLAYYRLKQVDLDGTETMFDVRAVEYVASGPIALWPNPAIDHVFLAADGITAANVVVVDPLGRGADVPVHRNGALLVLEVASLPKGHYQVLFADQVGRPCRFVKN